MSNLLLLAGPAREPLTLAEVKAHLRIDGDDEDALLSACIVAGRQACESYTGLSLITQTWQLYLDSWPSGALRLPRPPLRQVEGIRVYAADGTPADIDPSRYDVDTVSRPGRIHRRGAFAWPRPGRPLAGIEITYDTGYGDSWNDVPQALRQGMLVAVACLFETRDAAPVASLPGPAAVLWQPYRVVRL